MTALRPPEATVFWADLFTPGARCSPAGLRVGGAPCSRTRCRGSRLCTDSPPAPAPCFPDAEVTEMTLTGSLWLRST